MEEVSLTFSEGVEGLLRGDFTRLEPLFVGDPAALVQRPIVVEWFEERLFDDEHAALEEALTCACFLGRNEIVAYLIEQGLDPSAGALTWMNGIHWAVNRGNLETVRLLIKKGVPLETRNKYGGTVLDAAVWAAIHEPKPEHFDIIRELLNAGARREEVSLPTGKPEIDALLQASR